MPLTAARALPAGWPPFACIDSKLTPLGIILSLLLGCLAVIMLPREEEPQIKVPMIDVLVSMPGAKAKEVEERVSIPMEKLIYELPGIEYIYSTSMPGQSLLVARFYVGEKLEDAIVTLKQKLATNFDRIPQGVSPPLIKPHTIDDVPILVSLFTAPGTTIIPCAASPPKWTTPSRISTRLPKQNLSAARAGRPFPAGCSP